MKLFVIILNACTRDRSANSIAWALLPSFGLAVFPMNSLQWALCLGAVVLCRVNLLSCILFTFFFYVLTTWTDSWAHPVGEIILSSGFRIFPRLYHAPIVPYTLFNYTIVMGYLVFWVAVIPLCFFLVTLLQSHREGFVKLLYRTELIQSFVSSRFYRRISQYLRYENR